MHTAPSVLFLGSCPAGLPALALTEEANAIDDALLSSDVPFRFHQRHHVTTEDISSSIHRFRPQVVHLSCHGLRARHLILEQDMRVSPVDLTATLEEAEPISCLVLNACHSDVHAALVAAQVGAVIGIRGRVSDRAARAFTTGFYEHLGSGHTIAVAFDAGRAATEESANHFVLEGNAALRTIFKTELRS
jgi:CHAT domain-containing protein